jgi:sugar phosphate isomerase/epimerase
MTGFEIGPDEEIMVSRQERAIGIFSWFGFKLPLADRLVMIRNAGFEATSLWWGRAEDFEDIPKHEVAARVRDAGLLLENIHAPYENSNNLWSEDRTVRDAAVRNRIGWVEDCAKYDVPIMVMHITCGVDQPEPNNYGLDSIARILETAEALGVTVAIENTRRVDYLETVMREITSPNLGFCYDTSHDWATSETPTTLLRQWSHRLVNVHLSDNDGLEDRHWLPGEGIVDWMDVCDILSGLSFPGHLMLEVVPTETEFAEGPIPFLEKAYDRILWIRKLFDGR